MMGLGKVKECQSVYLAEGKNDKDPRLILGFCDRRTRRLAFATGNSIDAGSNP